MACGPGHGTRAGITRGSRTIGSQVAGVRQSLPLATPASVRQGAPFFRRCPPQAITVQLGLLLPMAGHHTIDHGSSGKGSIAEVELGKIADGRDRRGCHGRVAAARPETHRGRPARARAGGNTRRRDSWGRCGAAAEIHCRQRQREKGYPGSRKLLTEWDAGPTQHRLASTARLDQTRRGLMPSGMGIPPCSRPRAAHGTKRRARKPGVYGGSTRPAYFLPAFR